LRWFCNFRNTNYRLMPFPAACDVNKLLTVAFSKDLP